MGHVPPGPFPEAGAGNDLPRRQRRRGRTPRTPAAGALDRASIGALGEQIAANFLSDRGARVVGRNVRLWPGEIDLLIQMDGALVAVEVKTRSHADPVEELTDLKIERVRRSGDRLEPRPDRYDLVAVRLTAEGAEVRWLPAVC